MYNGNLILVHILPTITLIYVNIKFNITTSSVMTRTIDMYCYRIQGTAVLDCLVFQGEGSKLLRNVGTYLLVDMA
jgi:hypothetical protein